MHDQTIHINQNHHIHFVGVGGVGMSSLAEWALSKGHSVSGSDTQKNELTQRLEDLGACIQCGHEPNYVKKADLVVFTSAVKLDENPELIWAQTQGIQAIKRSEFLAVLLNEYDSIGVAGTHGKTSTTTMLGLVLEAGDCDPLVYVGGRVPNFEMSNIRLGKGKLAAVEADEYDRTFLKLGLKNSIVTNIDHDHLDVYATEAEMDEAFVHYLNKLRGGVRVVCGQDAGWNRIKTKISEPVVEYGLEPTFEVYATEMTFGPMSTDFRLHAFGEDRGLLHLKVPGKHNVLNALGVAAMALKKGVSMEQIRLGLLAFTGVERRFQKKYETEDMLVFDDYAHHPAEIEATLSAVRSGWPEKRVIAVFQPHLYSRTNDFYQQFALALQGADVIIVTDVYPAREKAIEGVSGKMIADLISSAQGRQIIYAENKAEVPAILLNVVRKGDFILTMGAGDIYRFGEVFIQRMKEIEVGA